MPLKKLWNTLRGITTHDDVVAPNVERVATPPVSSTPHAAKTTAPKQAVVKPAVGVGPATERAVAERAVAERAATAKAATARPTSTPTPPAKTVTSGRGILSMLSRGEHDGLIKSLAKLQPASLLEIGIGDGSRTPALVHALAESTPSLKYAVIDQFEMVGGDVTLREFHARLAGSPIRPSIIPEPALRGVVTVLHRLGLMDVVLIDPLIDDETQIELNSVLCKVSHAGTTVLRQVNGKWVATRSESRTARRAA